MSNLCKEKDVNVLEKVFSLAQQGKIQYTDHAETRLEERKIIKPEVRFVLKNGWHEEKKDQYNKKYNDWKYSIRGKTIDGRSLRVIVVLEEDKNLIITAIDLDAQGEETLD